MNGGDNAWGLPAVAGNEEGLPVWEALCGFQGLLWLSLALAGPPNDHWLLDEELGNKNEDQARAIHNDFAFLRLVLSRKTPELYHRLQKLVKCRKPRERVFSRGA